MHLSLCTFLADKGAGLENFAVVYILFPFKLLHRLSGNLLVTELKVPLLLGNLLSFYHYRNAASSCLWAKGLTREEHPLLG